jgi:hypothetical protein
VTRRREITAGIISLLPVPIDINQALQTWYVNLRESGGFRLTDAGFLFLISAGINSWNVDIDPKSFTKKTLIQLDRKLRWPYYIDAKHRKLRFFGSQEAVLASLYGDINSWLDKTNTT